MHAIVMVGGKGTRLLPHTRNTPKALLGVGGRSILEILVDRLRQAGTDRITMCVSHLADAIRQRFGDGCQFGVALDYAFDREPMGTAGPLLLVEDWHEAAVIVNGDVLSTIDFAQLHRAHCAGRDVLTVATHTHRVPIELGVLDIADGQVVGVREKPELTLDVAAGIYVADPAVREHIPADRTTDMPALITTLTRLGASVGAYRFSDEWHDIGTPQKYALVQQRALEDPVFGA
ncbi:sugar phosphate nucleotidyltransferase [Micromonospora sp. CPCC 205539]|uniref:sugar phosphate nucleotidyltransferase n=1 Tax=Micromonospora sp. CPCC 205539 TaxID=3122408 RepID=UPI002FEF0498